MGDTLIKLYQAILLILIRLKKVIEPYSRHKISGNSDQRLRFHAQQLKWLSRFDTVMFEYIFYYGTLLCYFTGTQPLFT